MRHVKTGEKEGKNLSENLEGLVSGGWFDTVNAGLKAERGSYVKIAEALEVSFPAFLFRSYEVRLGRGVADWVVFCFSSSPILSFSSATTLRRLRLRSLLA
jgi:hypothetical protein